jgi:hypothetical protein
MAQILCDVRSSPEGTLLELSFVPDSGTSGPGTFSARIRRAGDASFSAAFTPIDSTGANLRSDGNGFAFDKERATPDRWILSMVKDGDSTISEWWSADDGVSWTRF